MHALNHNLIPLGLYSLSDYKPSRAYKILTWYDKTDPNRIGASWQDRTDGIEEGFSRNQYLFFLSLLS